MTLQLTVQIAALDSRKRRLEINLARNPEEMNDVGQYIYRECQNLLFELDILGNSLSALPQHVRVTVSKVQATISPRIRADQAVWRLYLQVHSSRIRPG